MVADWLRLEEAKVAGRPTPNLYPKHWTEEPVYVIVARAWGGCNWPDNSKHRYAGSLYPWGNESETQARSDAGQTRPCSTVLRIREVYSIRLVYSKKER